MNSNHIVLKMAAVKVKPPSWQDSLHLPGFNAMCIQISQRHA